MTGPLLLALYQAAGTLAVVVLSPWLVWRFVRRPREMAERSGLAGAAGDPGPERPLWIHAASLGELEGLRALLSSPGGRPANPLLLTVLSVSARDSAADLERDGIRVRFAPLDLWFCLRPFLRRERPRGLLLLETELWPATLAACRARGIPVALVSGRLSARKWGTTRWLRPWLRTGLSAVAGCAAQSEADAARFRRLGLTRVTVTGNLKYRDSDVAPERPPEDDGQFLFVAGSLRRGEEPVLDALRSFEGTAVVAPRHRRERDAWARELRQRGLVARFRSEVDLKVPERARLRNAATRRELRRNAAARLRGSPGAGKPVLLVDTHGELGAWYAAADAAFVGGTLAPIGGHNLFEPAREGVPIAFGPHTGGVRDLAEPLLRLGGAIEVNGGEELAEWLHAIQEDPLAHARAAAGARRAALEVSGAVERTRRFLSRWEWIGLPPVAARETGEGDESVRAR